MGALFHVATGIGDACDDYDGDGIFDDQDVCVRSALNNCTLDDLDGDGVLNASDNCPSEYNPILYGVAQEDLDQDGIGEACEFNDSKYFEDKRPGYRHFYRTVTIGSQTWMAQNLAVNADSGQSRCYQDDFKKCMDWGALYTWSAAQKVCPPGWHLPDTNEWNELIQYVGEDSAGIRLRTTYGWPTGNEGTDLFGFAMYPAGFHYYSPTPHDTFDLLSTRYWAVGVLSIGSNSGNSYYSYAAGPALKQPQMVLAGADTTATQNQFSVRCLKDD